MSDPIFDLIDSEYKRQKENLELIASENYVSENVLKAMGSCLTNKYAEGYPGKRYYGGCEYVDQIEQLAIDRACSLFHAEHANVQPHSGSQANMAAYAALLQPGDRILSASLNSGGHLTHSSPFSFVGKLYNVFTYEVNDRGVYDMNEVRRIAFETHPKLIVAGASAYPRSIDFKAFRRIADEVNAYLMVDMAHIAGLVAAGVHMSPVPYADIVTSTTHKTLRGPRGGLILCKKEYAKAIDSAVFPRCQGGGLQHIVAAKGICFAEAATEEFKLYAEQIVSNAQALASALSELGFKIVTNGTDNHLLLIDLTDLKITGKEAETILDRCGITVNKNMIPGDTRKPNETSGIRIGTAAVTTRGMKEAEMRTIAEYIYSALVLNVNPDIIKSSVYATTKHYPLNSAEA